MASLSPTTVRALKSVYTLEQLETERERLAAELLAGVTITSLGTNGGTSSGTLTASPAELIEAVQSLIETLEAEADDAGLDAVAQGPLGCHVDFSTMTHGD